MIRQLTTGAKRGLYTALILMLMSCAILSAISSAPITINAQTSQKSGGNYDKSYEFERENAQPLGISDKLVQIVAGLHMDGVLIKNAANDRVIMAGLNVEMYRDYAGGCDWVTNGQYAIRASMAQRIKALGVNVVRLNYAYRFLTGDNLTKFLDMATELATRGIYVMPADHTYTGNALTNSAAAYPMMKQIVDGMRARGLENYLIMGGFNEPGPDIAVSAWERAYQNLLTYLRSTAQFNGVVVIDGTGWSTLLDVAAFKRLMTFDATLRGGTANVIFSHHLYPNITALPAQIFEAANQVPLMIGELGQENPGASPLRPQYVKDVIASFLNAGMANGHNGLFAWIWAWCDSNTMLDDDWVDANGQASNVPYTDKSPLTTHGVLWKDLYYSKLPNAPPPQVTLVSLTPSRTPTRTTLPTNTPRPTQTRTPLPDVTPLATAVPTRTPDPAAIEVWVIKGKIGGWDVDLLIEKQR